MQNQSKIKGGKAIAPINVCPDFPVAETEVSIFGENLNVGSHIHNLCSILSWLSARGIVPNGFSEEPCIAIIKIKMPQVPKVSIFRHFQRFSFFLDHACS